MKKTIPSEAMRKQTKALKSLFNFNTNVEENSVSISNDPFEIIVFDTETSGLDSKTDRVVQISGIKFTCENGKLTEIDRLDQFINQPEYDENKVIPDDAFKAANGRDKTFKDLTGITNEMLSHYPNEVDAFKTVYEFFGDKPIVVGHNVPFDYGFITEMYIRNGKNFLTPEENRLDTLALARGLISKEDAPKKIVDGKERATYTLGALAGMYKIDNDEEDSSKQIGFHNSMNDVIVTSRLLSVLLYEFAQNELAIAIENAKVTEPIVKERAKIKSISYWAGYRGFSRIYVNAILRGASTSYFYDVRKRTWGEKDEGTIVATDMDLLIQDAHDLAGVTSDAEFGKITKEITADATFLKRYE